MFDVLPLGGGGGGVRPSGVTQVIEINGISAESYHATCII